MAIVLRTWGILRASLCLEHRDSRANPCLARLEERIIFVVGELVQDYIADSHLAPDAGDYGYKPDKFCIEYRTF